MIFLELNYASKQLQNRWERDDLRIQIVRITERYSKVVYSVFGTSTRVGYLEFGCHCCTEIELYLVNLGK